ncbi:choice-of-anchor J domain-containing protein [Carboxylicivirga caseinilyticus]|uniref:choice-of-anchor J domain-containing protein n=1 Tax=Carboxylicivirga caseinilyticus TaxID=3417572 RepID=UPI003D33E271|nr:choice-of-anchor J domain-containing protein [Marinilabiliaceae bacterium A049]
MRKSLLMMVAFYICILPFNFFGQKSDESSPTLIKSVRKGNQLMPVSPTKAKGKPLNSEIYLQTYKPVPASPFSKSQIGFRIEEQEVSLKLAEELGDQTLYANMVYSDTWTDYAIYEIPYGIYSFTASETTDFTIHYEDIGLACNAGVHANGKFYGIHPITLFGAMTGVGYFVVNTDTWEDEKNYIVDEAGYDAMASNMTFDPTTNTIFALRYNADLTGFNWATVDTASFTFNNLATWTGTFSTIALTTSSDGTIYGIGSNGNLYTFDKADGKPTLIGATGVYPANYSQSAVYNGRTNELLWCALTYTGSHMYTVNLTTGEATKLFSFPNNEQLVGLYTNTPSAKDEAPAAVADLTYTPDSDGALTGNISFTVPELSFSGSSLTGNLSVITKIDGIVSNEQDLAVGTTVTLPVSLTNENHTFSVITTNNTGTSPLTTLTKYIGNDNPKAVTNLTFSINEGISQLTWDAPTEGIYEGYINTSEMYYTVTRLPDIVVVADHLTATSFSETMPTIMARYSYEVVAYNGSEKPGVKASTQELVFGDGFEPPYNQPFEDYNALEYFNIVNNNGDNSTWQLLYQVVAYWPNTYENKDADDWLISPAMALKAGIKYKLNFSTKSLWSPGIESMKVSLGTSQTDISTFTQELWNNTSIDFYEYTDQSVEFSVETDGKYFIGFYAYSPDASSSGLYLDYLNIEKIGAFEAPAKVSDLTLTPDAADDLKATLSFTAPTLNLNGESLSEITQIEIFRNDDLTNSVYTFSNPVPGTNLTWTDENVPYVGYNSYTIIPSNSGGEGEHAFVRDFIGVYTAPYSESFDDESSMEFYSLVSLATETSNWSYNNYYQCIEGANWSNIADEWLFLPELKLEGNMVYEISFSYTTYGIGDFDLTLGRSATTEAQTVINSIPSEPEYAAKKVALLFSTDDEGNYVPALHMTAGDAYWYFFIQIDNIMVIKKAPTQSPGPIQNTVLQADANGLKQVNITFNAPSEAYNGGTLGSITKINIYKTNDIIASQSFESPAVGEELSWTDSNVAYGYVKYAFIAENEYGKGATVIDSVFVGPDTPTSLSGLTLTADASNANATLSWSAPVGENNGYIDYNSLTYNIYSYDLDRGEFVLNVEGITETTYNMQENISGEMQVLYYAVSPVLNDYEAQPIVGHVVLGTPYKLPFSESFAEMTTSTTPWVIAGSENSVWTVTSDIYTAGGLTVSSQDNDEGMLFFYNPYGYGSGYIEIPKVELYKKNVASNRLRFWLYQSPSLATQSSVMYLQISADDNNFESFTEEIPLNDGEGWTPYTFNLDDYKSSQYIKIRIYAYVNSYTEAMLLDNISIYSVFPEDLSVSSISGPESMVATETTEYAIGIQNIGSNDVLGSNYTISIYNGEQLLGTQNGVDLTAEETATINFMVTPDITEVGNTWNLNATIDYSADQVTSNNSSNELNVLIEAKNLPTVGDLSAMESEQGVLLNWTQPNLDYIIPEVEGFENHVSLSIDNFENWKTVDLDGQYTGVVTGLDYENAGEPMAYQIWNYIDANAAEYSMYVSPHSGDQCIISWSSAGVLASDESPVDPENNDWLISKEIKPGSQLSFWTKQPSINYGNETFEIWASSTTDAVEDFILVDSKELTTTDWILYSVQLPVDAKYFAIRHTSASFALMIDDISLTPAGAEVLQYNLLGYNIYRNNQKVNDVLVSETTYTDTPDASSSYSYAVNVSYEKGESALSNIVVVDFVSTGINPDAMQKGLIIGGKGQVTIKDLQGKNVKIHAVDGSLIDDFATISNNEIRYLSKGVYVVTIENKELSTKIIVY